MKTMNIKKWMIILIVSCYYLFSNFSLAAIFSTKNKFISYTDVGQGQPVVLIHAFPTDQRLWQPQQEGLKKYFRVVSLDLWGFGKSASVNGEAITMEKYADEVKALLDQLHIQKAIIGGESMGGYIALAYLKKYPRQVQGLILADTQSIADNDAAKKAREKIALEILQNGTTELIKNFLAHALLPTASSQTKKFLRSIVEEQTPTAMASALRGMSLRSDTSSYLAKTNLPVLILTGDQDTVISREQSEAMHKLAKNSRLVVIADASHLSNLEKPNEWNQAVINMFYQNQ